MRLYCKRTRRRSLQQAKPKKLTEEDVLKVCLEKGVASEFLDMVIDDVLLIVNDGFRYPPLPGGRYRQHLCVPEDISIPIALVFGVVGRES